MTAVSIDEVALEPGNETLVACGLDTPASGLESPYYGFDLRGWVIGRGGPARRVIVRYAAGELRDVPVDITRPDVEAQHPEREWAGRSGFFLPIGALKLDPAFELDLSVAYEDDTVAHLGTIRGRRAQLSSLFEPRIEPILLTSLGRTGSTAVMQLLSSHPEVVAYRPFEYEPRVVAYWIDLLQDLSEPVAFRRQVTPMGPLEDGWWAGRQPPYPRRLMDDQLQALLGGENIDHLALFAQERIDLFYRRVAELGGRPEATRFVEKFAPRTAGLTRELYPGAREIVLVRDFRDMVASIFAFNRKRGFPGFGRDRASSDVDYVTTRIANSVDAFTDAWRARSQDAHLVRYEDLVQRPRETVAGILEHLRLEAEPATIEGMLASIESSAADAHRTIAAPELTIGRWREDLPSEVKDACARALGPALRQFGYEVDSV